MKKTWKIPNYSLNPGAVFQHRDLFVKKIHESTLLEILFMVFWYDFLMAVFNFSLYLEQFNRQRIRILELTAIFTSPPFFFPSFSHSLSPFFFYLPPHSYSPVSSLIYSSGSLSYSPIASFFYSFSFFPLLFHPSLPGSDFQAVSHGLTTLYTVWSVFVLPHQISCSLMTLEGSAEKEVWE